MGHKIIIQSQVMDLFLLAITMFFMLAGAYNLFHGRLFDDNIIIKDPIFMPDLEINVV